MKFPIFALCVFVIAGLADGRDPRAVPQKTPRVDAFGDPLLGSHYWTIADAALDSQVPNPFRYLQRACELVTSFGSPLIVERNRRMRIAILALCVFLVGATVALAEPGRRKMKGFVGEVIVVGNTVTQDRVIRQALVDFKPGQILRPRNLKIAERKLASMRLFKVDPATRTRPTIQVLNSPGRFKDILVRVEETSTRQWKVETGLNAVGQPILRLIMDDRNFDPFRFPTSWADIMENKAFAGGGQRARLEVVRLNLFDARVTLFTDGSLLPAVVRAWFDEFRY